MDLAKNTTLKERAWLIALLCLVSGGALLGLSINLAKTASGAGLSSLAYLSWSVMGAALVLLVLSAIRRQLPPLRRQTIEYYAVSALVSVAGSNLVLFAAIPHVGAGFVSLTIALPPLLTYAGALALRMEHFNVMRAAGVAAALVGASILAIRKLSAPDADVLWILLALLGPVLLAVGNLYRTLRWPQGASADVLAPGMLVAAAIMLFGAGAFPGFSLSVPLDRALPLILIAVQSLIFAGQFLLLFVLQRAGGPVLLSLLGSVGAVVGVPIAIFLLGEAPPEGLFISAGLIATGIALVTLGSTKSQTLKRT